MILPAQLIAVPEVIDALPLLQPQPIEVLRYPRSVGKYDIPVERLSVRPICVAWHLLPFCPCLEDVVNNIPEVAAPTDHMIVATCIGPPCRAGINARLTTVPLRARPRPTIPVIFWLCVPPVPARLLFARGRWTEHAQEATTSPSNSGGDLENVRSQ